MRMLLIAIVLAAAGASAAAQDKLNRFADKARPAPSSCATPGMDGARHSRWSAALARGYNEAGNQGLQTCDGDLLGHGQIELPNRRHGARLVLVVGARVRPRTRPRRRVGPQAHARSCRRRLRAAFDARLAQFRRATRFALRPIVEVARYDAHRGALDAFMKIPLLNGFDIGGYRGQNIVPDMVGNGRSVYAAARRNVRHAAPGMTFGWCPRRPLSRRTAANTWWCSTCSVPADGQERTCRSWRSEWSAHVWGSATRPWDLTGAKARRGPNDEPVSYAGRRHPSRALSTALSGANP